jgi:nucleoid-associated protein YgaU
MANITKHLTSLSPDSRSGPPPGRRLLALVLVVMLALGSTFPGFALAGEVDSEGEGTAPPVEVPVDPGFDPGGEEEALEEAPASGGEEGGAVEAEPEVDLEVPPVDEVTGAATQAPSEAPPSQPVESPEPTAAAAPEPEPEPVQQQAPEAKTSEPVANQSIAAPKQKPAKQQAQSSGETSGETAPVGEPPQEEAPSAPPPQSTAPPPADHGRQLAGKNSYVVKSGDCLWHIAGALLPAGASDAEVAAEVARLWKLNESAIGTGDPNLIYAGTELRLR